MHQSKLRTGFYFLTPSIKEVFSLIITFHVIFYVLPFKNCSYFVSSSNNNYLCPEADMLTLNIQADCVKRARIKLWTIAHFHQ